MNVDSRNNVRDYSYNTGRNTDGNAKRDARSKAGHNTDRQAARADGNDRSAGKRALERAAEQYLAYLSTERALSENTLDAYCHDLHLYCEYLVKQNVCSVQDITAHIVEGFTLYLADSYAYTASSRARMVTAIRGWHRFLWEEGITQEDPAKDVHPPKIAQRLPKAITVEQMASLIEAASMGDPPISLRDRALLEILYGTGARISEAVNLTPEDVDLEHEAVRLFGKGRKERIVPLGSYAHEALDAYMVRGRPALACKGTGSPAIFLNKRGRPLSRQSAWEIIQTASRRAGLHNISPHTFRHSFATHLLQGGADIRIVQELLGHSSVNTTQIYTKVTPELVKQMYASSHPRAR